MCRGLRGGGAREAGELLCRGRGERGYLLYGLLLGYSRDIWGVEGGPDGYLRGDGGLMCFATIGGSTVRKE